MSVEMTTERWRYTTEYIDEVFGDEDVGLARIRAAAIDAGLPNIAISPVVGRFLSLLTAMTPGRLAVEIGTLGGYSAAWITRGLADDGRLISIEMDPGHAEFAEAQLTDLGLQHRVEILRGSALDVLPDLVSEIGPASIDAAFLDGDKREYPDYWRVLRPAISPGGLLIADNILGTGSWWIDDEESPERQGVDALSRMLASDDEFDAVALPLREGLLVARRRVS